MGKNSTANGDAINLRAINGAMAVRKLDVNSEIVQVEMKTIRLFACSPGDEG